MATVNIAFNLAMQGNIPAIGAIPASAESITSSATSQQSASASGNGTACRVTAINGNVWVKFGVNPVAAAGSDYLIPSGSSHDFGNVPPGFKVAVVDAA